jgi:hypothetical protein
MTDRGSPELPELIAAAIDSALKNVHVSMPGIVTKYSAASKTVDVQPACTRPVEKEDGGVVYEKLPECRNVPIAYQGATQLSLTFPLAVGDSVMLVWQDYSFAGWRRRGKVSDPQDTRHNGPGYPVAVPWYRPDGGAGENDAGASIGLPGGLRLTFWESAISAGTGVSFVALATKVDLALAALSAWAAAFSPGGAPGAATGATAGAALVSALSGVGSVASSNLKAD